MSSNIPFRDRFGCSVPEAQEALGGVGRTKFYELVKEGVIETRKLGSKTIVVVDSLKMLIEKTAAAPARPRQ